MQSTKLKALTSKTQTKDQRPKLLQRWASVCSASPIKTTSLVITPFEVTRCPSRDQSKEKISRSLKSVNCFAVPPSIGWAQTFSNPPRLSTKVRLRLSALQRRSESQLTCTVGATSKVRTCFPVSNEKIASFHGVL